MPTEAKPLVEPLLSERYSFLIDAAVTYWTRYVPVESQEIFSTALYNSVVNHMEGQDVPQAGRRLPLGQASVRLVSFGVGIYNANSDAILRLALRAADVAENLLPRQTHTIIDTENGNAFVDRFDTLKNIFVREGIFPIFRNA